MLNFNQAWLQGIFSGFYKVDSKLLNMMRWMQVRSSASGYQANHWRGSSQNLIRIAERNAFRHHDARQQSRSFALRINR
jgi:hypothetical protein